MSFIFLRMCIYLTCFIYQWVNNTQVFILTNWHARHVKLLPLFPWQSEFLFLVQIECHLGFYLFSYLFIALFICLIFPGWPGIYCVAQADLNQLEAILPQLPEWWNFMSKPWFSEFEIKHVLFVFHQDFI